MHNAVSDHMHTCTDNLDHRLQFFTIKSWCWILEFIMNLLHIYFMIGLNNIHWNAFCTRKMPCYLFNCLEWWYYDVCKLFMSIVWIKWIEFLWFLWKCSIKLCLNGFVIMCLYNIYKSLYAFWWVSLTHFIFPRWGCFGYDYLNVHVIKRQYWKLKC